jgi:hypothetical protein
MQQTSFGSPHAFLTLCWPSSGTFFVVPTLVVSVAPIPILVSFLMTTEFLTTFVMLLGFEAHLEVIFDWLMSSSKLQSCLKLCWFVQAFLKLEL